MDKKNDACPNNANTMLQTETLSNKGHLLTLDADYDDGNGHQQKRYYFYSGPLDGKYLTYREAECVYLMLHGYTNAETAHKLNLSPRTIEYYLKNIREKLNCFSKIHLLRVMSRTDFLDTFEPEALVESIAS